jgi:alkaline phosphatase D
VGQAQFADSVASGDPAADAIVLWTRVTPDRTDASTDVAVRGSISEVPSERKVATGEVVASPQHDLPAD